MDMPVLRNTLTQLRAISFDRSVPANASMAPQEMLDFLAMLAGIKPVYLLGRGFDDPQWVEGLVALARKKRLYLLEGPMWDAGPVSPGAPIWLHDYLNTTQGDRPAFYICRTRANAEAVQRSFENPPITMEEEARLLGYPLCCVREHYEQDALFEHAFYMLLQRHGQGDVAEMMRLLREDVAMNAETPEEEEAFTKATSFNQNPFTSFQMCSQCAEDSTRPAGRISRRYEQLARTVDQRLAREIFASVRG
jgi:hypothetical protein